MKRPSAVQKASQPLPPNPFERQTKKELEHMRKRRERTDFRICRRRAAAKPEHFQEWTGIDRCAGCGEDVLYNKIDSEGMVHVCVPCAAKVTNPTFTALRDDPVENLDDEEQFAKIAMSMAQNKANENVRRL